MTVSGTGLSERGGWRGSKRKAQTGTFHRADCTGLLVYTRDGHMSVQVMYRNPPAGANAAPLQYAQGGYEASFGIYEIDERTHTFTYHVGIGVDPYRQRPEARIRLLGQPAYREVV